MTNKQARLDETNHARKELYETFALLSDRLNFAQRFDEKVEEKTAQVKALKRNKPAVFFSAVAGVAAVTGVVVWAVAKGISRKF